jgi:hypothetical protein
VGPLVGAEEKIKKRICRNCIDVDENDLFMERFNPKSKFCERCCV